MSKKFLTTAIICLLVFPSVSKAEKWVEKSNDELRGEFLAFTKSFRDQMQGELIYDDLGRFIAQVEAVSSKDPQGWIPMAHRFISDHIVNYAPGMSQYASRERNSVIRKNLLMMRDYPMHSTEKNFWEPYLSETRAAFLKWIDTPAPPSGSLQIFKIYNMAYCLRTSRHTVLIDFKWDGTEAEMDHIASKADVLVLTHNHNDHFTQYMFEAMARAGKYLVMPVDKVPDITYSGKCVMTETFSTPVNLGGVKVQGFLGEQNGTPNFVYVIEFDGWRFADAGDNQVEAAEAEIASLEAVDVLTTAIFARPQTIMGYAKKAVNAGKHETLFLSSHENEKSHDVAGRIGFDQGYGETSKFGSSTFDYPPFIIWECGECITLTK